MKRIIISLFAVISIVLSHTQFAEAACTAYIEHTSRVFCDTNSGWCTPLNPKHSYMKKITYRRSCTNTSGRQWFELKEGMTKVGCC